MPPSSPTLGEVAVFSRSPVVSSSSGLSLIWVGVSRDGVLRMGRGGGRGEQALEVELEAAEGVGEDNFLHSPDLSCLYSHTERSNEASVI